VNKIVALWCHPRSMSTSVERLMRERGDFDCLHEPFMYHYYLHQKQREMPYFEPKDGHPVSYEGVRDMIMDRARTSSVFFKDMAYYVDSDMVLDNEFCESVTHCFLIRSPQAAIASYYRLDNAVTLPEIGFEAQWSLYHHLVDSGIKPVVIQAESIRKDPRDYIGNWWKFIGLKNHDDAFNWGKEPPEDWKQVSGWHQSSMASTSIHPWTTDETKKEVDNFETAARNAPHLRSYLRHHEPYYDRLKKVSL